MKKLMPITLFFFIISCTSLYTPQQQYNNLQGLYKAKAVGINSNGYLNGAWGISAGNTISSAKWNAINICRKYSAECIIEWENNKYVFLVEQKEYLDNKQKDYILAKREICTGYGFKTENAIAICVQKEINNDRLLARAQINNSQQKNSINWSALSELGASLTNQANNNYVKTEPFKRTYFLKNSYMDGMNRVCVYDGWTETMSGIGICPTSIKR